MKDFLLVNIFPRQRKFQSDLKIINDCLDGVIQNAKETRQETDIENSSNVTTLISRSILRFLVDMRGVDIDQLMTGMQDYISYCTSILLHKYALKFWRLFLFPQVRRNYESFKLILLYDIFKIENLIIFKFLKLKLC
uniref:Uncharacterized protein n=1 Tax=Brassica campestris TaxID=3711 RepID=A0A3P6BYA6_BRACM|nr:unnamed protein product [Brassica rapa]